MMCGYDIRTLCSIALPVSSTETTTTATSSSLTTNALKNNDHANHLSNQHCDVITDMSRNKNNNVIASSDTHWKTNTCCDDAAANVGRLRMFLSIHPVNF